MGIKNLNNFLKKNHPEIFREEHLSKYKFKKVAIDVSIFMYKYKYALHDRWLYGFVNLILVLRKYDIHITIIYDGSSPIEKSEEQKNRKIAKDKIGKNVCELEDAYRDFTMTNIIPQILIDLYNKITIPDNKKLIVSTKNTVKNVNMSIVEREINRLRLNIINITKEDFDLTKELFNAMSIPYLNAIGEAEILCIDLCKRGVVDYVLSDDSDCIAYGVPSLLSKINTQTETVVEINNDYILSSLNFTYNQLVDLCILCGCDYNKNVAGIGPSKAYKLLKTYESIEGIIENTFINFEDIPYTRSRELFKNHLVYNDICITPICITPSFELIKMFFNVYNIYIDEIYVKNILDKNFIMEE